MPGIRYGNKERSKPRWAQDEIDRHSMIQGGAHLVKTEFTLPNANGRNIIPSGTLIGRTYAEKEAGIGYGSADIAGDDQIYLTIFDVDYDDDIFGADGHVSIYRHGCQVREEKLPGWNMMDAATKAKIRELYKIV